MKSIKHEMDTAHRLNRQKTCLWTLSGRMKRKESRDSPRCSIADSNWSMPRASDLMECYDGNVRMTDILPIPGFSTCVLVHQRQSSSSTIVELCIFRRRQVARAGSQHRRSLGRSPPIHQPFQSRKLVGPVNVPAIQNLRIRSFSHVFRIMSPLGDLTTG
jgi:hypothetical protein